MSRLGSLAALLLVLVLGSVAGQDDNTKLRTITYDGLGKLVRSHKGKPLVVYVWHFS